MTNMSIAPCPGWASGLRVTPPCDIAQALADLLLTLYEAAHQQPVERFRHQALAAIGRFIPYDGAHWSLAAGREIYGMSLLGLPEHSTEWFNQTDDRHAVARRCRAHPGQALCFGPEELADTSEGLALARYLNAQHLLVTTGVNQASQLWHMLGLIRGTRAGAFKAQEQQLLQLLTPHLRALLRVNEFAALARVRAEAGADRTSMAVVDARGVLQAVEPLFEAWLMSEWPRWSGPFLPRSLHQALLRGATSYAGEHVMARFKPSGDRILVIFSLRHPIDRLTPRERAVAQAYALGHSHKEVARMLTVSPVTVRSYLRQVYDKLAINDKAQLASLMAQFEGAGAAVAKR